jgi:hypothetical protein
MIDFRIGSVRTINWTQVILTSVFVVLVIFNTVFVFKYISASKRADIAEAAVSKEHSNAKILDFAGLFIEKVLQANGEISFDERLTMETAVRDLKDQEISAQWQKFTQSRDEKVAQIEVTNLLKLLVDKTKNKK